MTEILTPISAGELIDKITILSLKAEKIMDAAKLANVNYELAALMKTRQEHIPETAKLSELHDKLYEINADLWVIEDDIRACESKGDFGITFIALARSVYVTNDERAQVKRDINSLLGSKIVEEKSYHEFRS